jgi:hypothetical protein
MSGARLTTARLQRLAAELPDRYIGAGPAPVTRHGYSQTPSLIDCYGSPAPPLEQVGHWWVRKPPSLSDVTVKEGVEKETRCHAMGLWDN